VNYSNKLHTALNKINSINNRLERMAQIQENTLNDIESNKQIIKSQLENIELSIKDIKERISNNSNRLDKESYNSPNDETLPSAATSNVIDYLNELKEKEEKLVYIELDNIYKDKKIFELEKNLKETITKYEDKVFQLQFELKNLALNNNNNGICNLSISNDKSIIIDDENTNMSSGSINKKEYETIMKKNSSKNIAKPKSSNRMNKNILPPTSSNKRTIVSHENGKL
jgi:hypothetical protein